MEEALKKFIAHWTPKEEVKGILLTGSYAVGIQNEHSDIDIRLILDDAVQESFKGLETIDGYCFSYLGRSRAVTLTKFNNQFFSHVKMEARMYNVGKIVYDPFDIVAEMKKVAAIYVATPLVPKNISESDLQLNMHSLYKKYEYITQSTPSDPFYDYNYILYLKNALQYYAEKVNAEMIYGNDSKLIRFLTDETYLQAYNFPPFPDNHFKTLWLSALEKKNLTELQQLHDFLRKHLHKFNEFSTHIRW
jgi:predicted nucleotidyltransferase